jgi:hypothetical protein
MGMFKQAGNRRKFHHQLAQLPGYLLRVISRGERIGQSKVTRLERLPGFGGERLSYLCPVRLYVFDPFSGSGHAFSVERQRGIVNRR